MNAARRSMAVKDIARDLGFASCGVTDLAPTPHADALDRWLAQGMAGTMAYMPRQAEKRKNPSIIVPGATCVVVVTRLYDGAERPCPDGHGKVARYARGTDYHRALQSTLARFECALRDLGPEGTIARAYLDAGPVPERELAQRAGLGWIGKNTMLLDPGRGSYSFIAAVFTDLDLAMDRPFEADRCGTCTRCLDACPTDAFPAPRILDARRCISYLTIESRDVIPDHLAPGFEGWLFGCDICQEVCPWNVKFSQELDDEALGTTAEMASLDLAWAAGISDQDFERTLGATALERTGPSGLRRNAEVLLNQRPVG